MRVRIPRLVVAGLSGDSGKTTVSLSIVRGMLSKGLTVSVFKKGPDYIDSAWLGAVGGMDCRNLDTYMVDEDTVLRRFASEAAESDIALIEGNRGIFDGKDVDGTHSTAGLAMLLQAPVLLVVGATKTTRTLAAIVKGCMSFDPRVQIVGVILNKVGGARHKKIVTDSIERYCSVPVLGAVPKLGSDASIIPGRHLGLVTPEEFGDGTALNRKLDEIAENHINMDAVIEVAMGAEPFDLAPQPAIVQPETDVRIGYFSDSVFTFYYPENLEALRNGGAELVRVSSLDDCSLPDIHGFYIGGGFPETHAGKLSENASMLASVRDAAGRGMPIYAECGGLIYLSESIAWKDRVYPMAGLFPVKLTMNVRPVGHGYTESIVDSPNPFFAESTVLRGHEFHYSGIETGADNLRTCMDMRLGTGIGGGRDALVYKSVLACYTHIHADGVSQWAEGFVDAARRFKDSRSASANAGSSVKRSSSGGADATSNHDKSGRHYRWASVKSVVNETYFC